ncbi:hypothetical protein BP00DRAFT_162073 [Aspergillus indologenus CBS 114.80]|uniref:Uncharacterized protein n=1 Tax=Aspergillus indologenus CBS 114.80 TaxID=1450541 RepID=A0A2V5ITW9_9EURO|nr:hypothetical protein BP00DRAFT_162073 [Aspergillus indologenus CBS 114.80]
MQGSFFFLSPFAITFNYTCSCRVASSHLSLSVPRAEDYTRRTAINATRQRKKPPQQAWWGQVDPHLNLSNKESVGSSGFNSFFFSPVFFEHTYCCTGSLTLALLLCFEMLEQIGM